MVANAKGEKTSENNFRVAVGNQTCNLSDASKTLNHQNFWQAAVHHLSSCPTNTVDLECDFIHRDIAELSYNDKELNALCIILIFS